MRQPFTKHPVCTSLGLVLGALLIGLAWLVWQINHRPTLDIYSVALDPAPFQSDQVEKSKLPFRVSFWGVSSLLFDDGEAAFLIDGFFTRPSFRQMRQIEPNAQIIQQVFAKPLMREALPRLKAVIPVHSHYDHAMDAPYIAQQTGAQLIGSSSTAQLARGQGLKEKQIQVVPALTGNQSVHPVKVGRFHIQFIPSKHSPGNFAVGEIDRVPTFPAKVTDLKIGDCYSLLIMHSDMKVLVHASAGYIDGALSPYRADWVFLGVGALGKQSDADIQRYWQQVVGYTKPKTVHLIHWDDFFRPIEEELVPLFNLLDNFDHTMQVLQPLAQSQGVALKIPRLAQPLTY